MHIYIYLPYVRRKLRRSQWALAVHSYSSKIQRCRDTDTNVSARLFCMLSDFHLLPLYLLVLINPRAESVKCGHKYKKTKGKSEKKYIKRNSNKYEKLVVLQSADAQNFVSCCCITILYPTIRKNITDSNCTPHAPPPAKREQLSGSGTKNCIFGNITENCSYKTIWNNKICSRAQQLHKTGHIKMHINNKNNQAKDQQQEPTQKQNKIQPNRTLQNGATSSSSSSSKAGHIFRHRAFVSTTPQQKAKKKRLLIIEREKL